MIICVYIHIYVFVDPLSTSLDNNHHCSRVTRLLCLAKLPIMARCDLGGQGRSLQSSEISMYKSKWNA